MVKVSKEALRDYLRESLFGYSEPGAVNVNPVVDPSAALTDPTNVNFSPQSSAELTAAIQNLVNSSKKRPEEIFDLVKDTLDSNDSEEQGNMNKKQTKLESAIRNSIKKLINEIGPSDVPQESLPPVRRFGYGVSAKDDPSTQAGQRSEKSRKDLKTKLEKMNVDEIFTEKDVKNFSRITEKVAKTTDQLIIAVLKKIIDDFKKLVNDYNKTLDKDDKFNLKEMNSLSKFFSQYIMFMSHARRTSSSADWNLVQPELQKIHTKLVDPSYVIYSGEKISNLKVADEISNVEKPLRLWLIETGRKIKEFEELRDESGTTKKSNINLAMFYRPLEPYFTKTLGFSAEDTKELINALVESMADESPANMTNILSQKLVLTAFFTRWETDVNEREIVDGVMLKDLFAEKETSRVSTFVKGATQYARDKASSRFKTQANLPTEQLFDMMVTRAVYALENELNPESARTFLRQGLPEDSIERIASEWFGDSFNHIVENNESYKGADFTMDEILDLIAVAVAKYPNVEGV